MSQQTVNGHKINESQELSVKVSSDLSIACYFVLGFSWPISMLSLVIYCMCSLALIIGRFFFPLPSPEWILSIFIDYYILENNSLLKAALKSKRIQRTDFRTVPTEHFGEKKGLVSICSLRAVNL